MADTKTTTKRSGSAKTSGNVLSDEERTAMQETIGERKKAAKLSPEEARAAGEADVQAKIAEMPEDDRAIPARLHELDLASGPGLIPRTWYGMPAYAKAGKVIGWDRDGLDMARVQDIGTGTAAVWISMTAVPGLRTQQTFFFTGIIAIDPPTLSFWDDEASMLAWAHRQATHKRQMDRYRATGNADRTSFTRLAAIRSVGTWYGVDPVTRAGRSWSARRGHGAKLGA